MPSQNEFFLVLRLVFKVGLSKNKIPTLKIKDVINQRDAIFDRIAFDPKKEPVLLPIGVQRFLEKYLKYLKSHRKYSTKQDDPLFPNYSATGITINAALQNFDRHLKKFSKNIGFNETRKAGVIFYCEQSYRKQYRKLKKVYGNDNYSHDFSLDKELIEKKAVRYTANQFRISKIEVEAIRKGNIPAAGLAGVDKVNSQIIKCFDKARILDFSEKDKPVRKCLTDFSQLVNKSDYHTREQKYFFRKKFIEHLKYLKKYYLLSNEENLALKLKREKKRKAKEEKKRRKLQEQKTF